MTTLETRYGQLEVPDVDHDLIGRFLARYGEWAYDEVRFVATALPKDKALRVFDVGAFVGTFGIGLSQTANVELTTFVEANSALTRILSDNVQRNARGHSIVVDAAVTPAGRELVASYDAQNLGSLSFAPTVESMRVQSDAPTRFVRLSELVAQSGRVDLIKMDVEGLEYSILDADRSLLEPGGPAFWLECNESPESLELVDLLVGAGLDVYYFAFPAFAPNNFLGNADPIFPWTYEAGLWANRGSAPILPAVLIQHECILKRIRSREELRHAMWQTPRWAPGDWQNLSRAETVAEAVHTTQGESFATFLVDPAVASRVAGPSLKDAFAELKASKVSHAQALVEAGALREVLEGELKALKVSHSHSLAEIRAMRTVLEDADRRLDASQVMRQAHDDLKKITLDAMRQAQRLEVEVTAADARSKVAEAKRAHAEQQLRELQRSPYWRISRPVRNFFGRHEGLRDGLRRVLSKVYRIVR